MIYRDFQDLKLSALGMGAMRLPVVDGNDGVVDEKAAAEMVDYAMSQGVNYYDTAWGYHEGNSELVMGRALKKYPRESFFLADKFPGYDLIYPQIGVGKRLDGGRRRVKKYLWSFFRTAPAGQVRP